MRRPDGDVWAVTLLGEEPVFCAGMDLRMMRDRVESDSGIERDVFPDVLNAIEGTGLRYERSLAYEVDDTRDYREGFEARIEDREPTFRGECSPDGTVVMTRVARRVRR